jgi:hypothetical protein
MNDKPFGHLTVEVDKVAVQRGGVYHGGIMMANGGTATVDVYDGLDATTGTLIDSFRATNGQFERNVYERGIDVREGLYVDVSDNLGSFTVFYDPPAPGER